jgi:putative colanic acid biosynthesis glycosyltransferase WcaI
MRVLVLTINYSPEPTGFAPHVAALCEHLASSRHDVVTIAGFPFAPYWRRWDDKGRGWIAHEQRNGVRLFRVRHFVPRRPRGLLARLWMEATYCLLALWTVVTRVRMEADVILYVGAQPCIAMLARALGWWRGRPYVIAINDLAAQAGGDVGIVRSGWLMALLRTFEMAAYRKASAAIVLCPAFRNALLADGFPESRIWIIPSPIDVDAVRPSDGGPAFRQAHAIDRHSFVVMYAGSMGAKQDLRTVVDAAQVLRTEREVLWVLVGEGEFKREIEQSVARARVDASVRFLPFQPSSMLAPMFAAADVLLLTQLATMREAVIPSKLLTYMSAGRPVLAAVHPDSEGARLLTEAGGGRLVLPENPQALAEGVIALRDDAAGREMFGRRNRRYAEAHFDVRRIVERQEAILTEVGTSWDARSAAV